MLHITDNRKTGSVLRLARGVRTHGPIRIIAAVRPHQGPNCPRAVAGQSDFVASPVVVVAARLSPWLAGATAASARLVALAILSFIGAADHAWGRRRPSLRRDEQTVIMGTSLRLRVTALWTALRWVTKTSHALVSILVPDRLCRPLQCSCRNRRCGET